MHPHTVKPFLIEDETRERNRERHQEHSHATEDVDRLRLEASHKPDRNEIKHHFECAGDAIFAFAVCARTVVYIHLRHACAHAFDEHGNEPVHLAVQVQLLNQCTTINL